MLNILRKITFAIYILLAIWLLLNILWLNPPYPGLFFVSLFILLLPLVIIIPNLFNGNKNQYIIAGFLAIFYCVLALTELLGNPNPGIGPYITSILSILAYISTIITARYLPKVTIK